MTSIEIIHVRPEHVDDILAIQTECGLSEWTREGYLEEIDRPDAVLIAARSGAVITGFLVGRCPEADESHVSQADIYNIGTRSAFRRSGIGTALLTSFIESCHKRGVATVWLDVRRSNADAKSFYRRHGFIKAGTRKSFYSNPAEDADVMVRVVSRPDVEQRYKGA